MPKIKLDFRIGRLGKKMISFKLFEGENDVISITTKKAGFCF